MKIFVKVKPKAGKELMEKSGDNNFIVSVKAAPSDGKANLALIKILSRHFRVARSGVKIISGHTVRKKIIEIIKNG